MNHKKLFRPLLLAAAAALALPALAQHNITVVNFGGANGAAQKKAYFEPFEKTGAGKVVAVEYNGEQAKIKAMVEAKKVTWDVVEVESPDLSRGCDEGLFEKMDWAKVGNKADFQKAAVHECGVGTFVWSTVMAYDGDKLKTAPTTWADFWDVKKFPGKRGLRKGAKYTLEFALMADGVAPTEVYKVLATRDGVDRAFRKLDELKPHIQWWEAGAQPPQYLASGDVVMSSAYNGRIAAVVPDAWPGTPGPMAGLASALPRLRDALAAAIVTLIALSLGGEAYAAIGVGIFTVVLIIFGEVAPKTFGALYLASSMMQLGSMMLMTYLALRLNDSGASETAGGALMAANALGMVLGGWVGRSLIAQVGHIRTYAACAGIICAAVLGHEFSASLPFWLVLRALRSRAAQRESARRMRAARNLFVQRKQ